MSLVVGGALLVGGCSGPTSSGQGTLAHVRTAPEGTATGSATTAVTTATGDRIDPRRRAVSALVAQRAAALEHRDVRGWLATVADPTTSFAAEQATLFARMSLLPVGRYGEQGVEVAAPLDAVDRQRYGADAWVASVHLVYELTGYDRGLRTFDVSYVVASTSSGWRLAGVVDTGDAQPWDLTPLRVLRSASSLVVGNVPEPSMRRYLALADAAHSRIASVWGTAVPAVVVVAKDAVGFVRQLNRSGDAGLDQVAAVTDGPLEPGHVASADRVYVNPTVFADLTEAGRRAVVTHELTHVTVRATTTRTVPMWLSEGFADQMGYATVAVSPRTVAAPLLTQVRGGHGPTRLPVDADFDPSHAVIGPVYNAAWLAVVRMAARYGEPRVVDLYRALAGGLPVDATTTPQPAATTAFPLILGVSEAAFTTDWLAYLKGLAG